MTPDLRRAVAVVDAHRRHKATIRAHTAGAVRLAWNRLGTYYGPDVDRFARTVVPLVAAGQRQTAAITDAYLTSLLGLAGADTGNPLDPADFTGDAVRSIDPLEEYRRPGIEVWSALADGVALTEAIQRGLTRADSLVATDLQLASTNIARARLADSSHVVGYERVPSGGKSCALCLVASTQRYHRADLMPIHPGCSCDVAPIIGSDDPGRVVNQGLLDETRTTIRARLGEDVNVDDPSTLRAQLVVRDHGEYGPTLTQAGQHFTDAAQGSGMTRAGGRMAASEPGKGGH